MDSTALKESLILHCKVTIKSLSQLLTTLQASDGIQDLQRDEETMAALSEIVSLASSISGIAAQSLDDGADPVEDGNDSIRDEAPVFILPSVRQDSAPKGPAAGPALPRTLMSRPSGPSMGFSPEGKRLHSILLHYPLTTMSGVGLPVAEKDRIQQDIELATSTPLGSRSYPRVRLLGNQVVLILHDDADELEGLRSRFVLAQQSLWEQSSRIDVYFRFVRAWGDPLTLLIFRQHDILSHLQANVMKKTIEDIVAGRKDVVGALMARVPVLRQHQLGLHDGLPTGAKIHQGGHIVRTPYQGDAKSSRSFHGPRLAVIVPMISDDFDFAQDFAAFNSPFIYEGLGFEIKAHRLQDPSDWLVKDSFRWDSDLETVTSYA